MAIVQIKHKCITIARDYARKNSTARHNGRSVFIKRCYGSYRLIAVVVTTKQRSCRDIFAKAQMLASAELKQWHRHRYWARQARRHNVQGAHRMAVSYFYRLLNNNNGELDSQTSLVCNSLKHKESHIVTPLLQCPRHASHTHRLSRAGGLSEVASSPDRYHVPILSRKPIIIMME